MSGLTNVIVSKLSVAKFPEHLVANFLNNSTEETWHKNVKDTVIKHKSLHKKLGERAVKAGETFLQLF